MPGKVPMMHEMWREDATGLEVILSRCGDTRIWYRSRENFEAGDIDHRDSLPRDEFLERFSFKTGAYE